MEPARLIGKWGALAASAVALMAVLGACGGDPPQLPPGEPDQTPADELSQTVAAHLTAADFEEPEDYGLLLDVRGDLLFVRGIVDGGSRGQVYDELEDAPDVRVVVLTNVPGSAHDEENLALGRMLREAGMVTYLPSEALVASGGTDLFLSGARRIVERGALVGVHSWADSGGTNGDDLPRDDPEHELFLDYYRQLEIPEDFYWFTLESAPPEDMHWMSEAEMERYAIHTEPPAGGDKDDAVSSDDPLPTPEPTREVPDDMVQVPAPIDSVDIHVAESWPPQYFVEVVSGLPNACAEFHGYEESRSENSIVITVTNLAPAPSQQVACAEIYRTHRTSIPLGSDFRSGETYTVQVNDTTNTFVAQ